MHLTAVARPGDQKRRLGQIGLPEAEKLGGVSVCR